MKVLEKVAKFCHKNLNEEIKSYLTDSRQLDEEVIKKFEIGCFPNDLRVLFEKFDPKELRKADVIEHASKSRFRLWKLTFPIRDAYGNYIALAGRLLLDEEQRGNKGYAKYMNSRYKKTHHLFGLDIAKRSILEKDIVYVVEGYFDVIMAHQSGIHNIVAVCGKYFSMYQMAILSRYTKNIVLLFDNEVEAIKMANKVVEKRTFDGINLVAKSPLPDNYNDIDDYLKEHSKESLLELLNEDKLKSLW